MKKSYLFIAAAALFAACSSDSLTTEQQTPQTNPAEQAVTFGAYVNRGTTRAGWAGGLDNNSLAANGDGKANGFGVFGYYTNNEGYSELAQPDFMYNQHVYSNGSGGWTYSPIKYWPNEFGTEAASERVDYLTFFAYAPYVASDPKTGKVATTSDETGIIGMTRNTSIGDPLIKYVAAFDPAQCVDLCWGVVAENFTETVTQGEPKNNLEVGKPWIDVIKPLTSSKIKFDFKHALAQLNVQIDADIDDDTHGHSNAVNDQTRIYVRSVTFEGFTDRGTLNLNSDFTATNKPIWYDIAGTGNLSTTPITIYDGRYDGREGVASVAAPAESPLGLNSKLIQSTAYSKDPFGSDSEDPGVTKDAQNLFNSTTVTTPILVIPNGQPLTVKVVYDVETYDPSLAQFLSDGKTHGSTIENAIKKTITLTSGGNMTLEAGKQYVVNLHLGLTSVKFDAMVSAWDPTAVNGAADLPINNGTGITSSVSAGGTLNANMPAAGGTYVFTFSDAEGAISLDPAVSGASVSYSGKTVTVTIDPNNTLSHKDYALTIKDAASHSVTVNITQAPAALGLHTPTNVFSGATSFSLAADKAPADWSDASVHKTFTKKYKGVTSTISPTVAADGTVTIAAVKAGEEYTITVQTGEAEAETVSFTVGKAAGTLSAFTNSNVNYSIAAPSVLNQTVSNTPAGADGTITYSIAKTSGTGATTASIVPTSGVVTLTSATSGDIFTVTATVEDGEEYTYAAKTQQYTITIID